MPDDTTFVALMTLVQSRAVSLSSHDLVKMEERKRPATYENDESAPPLKRQATAVNGASKSHIDAEMPWKDDLDVSATLTWMQASILLIPIDTRSQCAYSLLLSSASRKRPSYGRRTSTNVKRTVLKAD